MITYHNGDILKSGADVIHHQVNCMGVIGCGLVSGGCPNLEIKLGGE